MVIVRAEHKYFKSKNKNTPVCVGTVTIYKKKTTKEKKSSCTEFKNIFSKQKQLFDIHRWITALFPLPVTSPSIPIEGILEQFLPLFLDPRHQLTGENVT